MIRREYERKGRSEYGYKENGRWCVRVGGDRDRYGAREGKLELGGGNETIIKGNVLCVK